MEKLTPEELTNYTRKIIKFYFPNVDVNARPVDIKLVVFALYIHQRSIEASQKIRLLEEIWKGTITPLKIVSLNKLAMLLTKATTNIIKGYLKGEVKLLPQKSVQLKWTSWVHLYYRGDDDSHPYYYIDRR